MRCPFCQFESTKVVDSRLTDPGDAVRRRRQCEGCGSRFTTFERTEGPMLVVRKRDGRRERFDHDKLVSGITRIYNETPIRQGRKFLHYGKSFDQVKVANATYLGRSKFIGAFFNNELIGFIKFVTVNNVARIMQILSMEAHADKRPTNALLAKAIGVCCENGATHFIYGKYVYGRKQTSPVTEFKRRNGFEQFDFPRYYVPLTRFGALAIRCGLHRLTAGSSVMMG